MTVDVAYQGRDAKFQQGAVRFLKCTPVLLTAIVALVTAPSCVGEDCTDANACSTSNAKPEGSDGGTPSTAIPDGCDLSVAPDKAPACIADEIAIFVSPTGADGNDGTKARPVRTIGAALSKLQGKPRIYVCDGTYREPITVTIPVGLHGGFSCADWTPNGVHPKVEGTTDKPALVVSGASGVVVTDQAFATPPADARGASSIAGLIVTSSVTLQRTLFKAGAGQPGIDAPSKGTFQPATAPKGGDGDPNGVALAPAVANPLCPTSVGGASGKVPNGPFATGGKPFISPAVPATNTGAPGTNQSGEPGHDGSHGNGGAAGSGATSLGLLGKNGWLPEAGQSGGAGSPGQGGGGGASPDLDFYPGGGGPGGCGGAGGAGGGGGGASVALAVLDSPLVIEQSFFMAGSAGRGGTGGQGQIAQRGGPTGDCLEELKGGTGGAGGSGGGGGGGAGGISVGILWKGRTPLIDGRSTPGTATLDGISVGAPGDAGKGGASGPTATTGSVSGATGLDGRSGVAQAILGL